jgi:plastocyanin
VTYDGPIPDAVPVPEAGRERELIEVDAGTKGLKDAVVWLETPPAGGKLPLPPKEPAVMDQQGFFFVPHVIAVVAGTEVEFKNSDAANHGLRATALEPANCFNIVKPPGESYRHTFHGAKFPVAIQCPFHGGMAAWVCVFEHPYFAVTGAKGTFRLPPAPAGRYTLAVRHLDGKLHARRVISLEAGAPATISIALEPGS